VRTQRTPGNSFETLSGDRKGQYSIRINDQWRICFEWPEGSVGPVNVEIVDYHESRDAETTMGRPAIHPGEHLAEELKALGMSAAELARQMQVPTNRVTEILNGQRALTGDTARQAILTWYRVPNGGERSLKLVAPTGFEPVFQSRPGDACRLWPDFGRGRGTAAHALWLMKITQDVRDYAAKHGIAEETAAIAQGLREKAEEFRKSGGEIYRRA